MNARENDGDRQTGILREWRFLPGKDISPLGTDGREWLVIAWFTPDYRKHAERLSRSLEKLRAPHCLLAVEAWATSWERRTMLKPQIVEQAMQRWPGKTLILVDADCEVLGDPQILHEMVKADIAVHARSFRRRRLSWASTSFGIRSGTMVFRPTDGARRLVREWNAAIGRCGPHDVDQTALVLSVPAANETTFQFLPVAWCSIAKERTPATMILHGVAGKSAFKVPKRIRGILPAGAWYSRSPRDASGD